MNSIDSEERFTNKTVETQVSEFNELRLNIYSNYIFNKTVLCDEKDPPSMSDGIRTVMKLKNHVYKEHFRSKMRQDAKFECHTQSLNIRVSFKNFC